MSGPCCLKDKDRGVCVCVRSVQVSIFAGSRSLLQSNTLSFHRYDCVATFVPQIIERISGHLYKMHNALKLPRCLLVSVILCCPTRVSDLKMLDAETRFPSAAPYYSDPVCAINSNSDVCHQPSPLPSLLLPCPPSSLPHLSILAAGLQDPSADEELMGGLLV